MVIGHAENRQRLEASLPRVSLFLGPTSVGKRTLALYLKDYYEVRDDDFFLFDRLDADDAREIVRVSQHAANGDFRLVVIQMDGSAGYLQDALLMTLEDSDPTVKFILISSERLNSTLMSRAELFSFPLLTTEEVEQVLANVLSRSANLKGLAEASGGQIERAFTASRMSDQRALVIMVLLGFKDQDAGRIESAAKSWSREHTALLETWCRETITGRWRVFEADDVELPDRKLAIRLLLALRGGVRPRLVVRSKLMDVWKDYTA